MAGPELLVISGFDYRNYVRRKLIKPSHCLPKYIMLGVRMQTEIHQIVIWCLIYLRTKFVICFFLLRSHKIRIMLTLTDLLDVLNDNWLIRQPIGGIDVLKSSKLLWRGRACSKNYQHFVRLLYGNFHLPQKYKKLVLKKLLVQISHKNVRLCP